MGLEKLICTGSSDDPVVGSFLNGVGPDEVALAESLADRWIQFDLVFEVSMGSPKVARRRERGRTGRPDRRGRHGQRQRSAQQPTARYPQHSGWPDACPIWPPRLDQRTRRPAQPSRVRPQLASTHKSTTMTAAPLRPRRRRVRRRSAGRWRRAGSPRRHRSNRS